MPTRRLALMALVLLCPLSGSAQDKNEEFFAAARKGDTAVKALLDKGVDVNAKTRYGATALSYACDKGHIEVVKLLIERGADVNVKDTFYGEVPLGWALSKDHIQIVKLLLDKGATGIERVLMSGVQDGNIELVKVALDKGGLKPETLNSALRRASAGSNKEIVELLKKAGPKYELLATNQMGEVLMATPAISDGIIFVRGQHSIFAVAERSPASAAK